MEDEVVFIGDSNDARFYIKATATFQDGEFVKKTIAYAREPLSKKGMDDSQITGTASSYARKYALNGLFCIDDNKDADTNEYAEQTKSTIEDIVDGIRNKMTLDNWKGFYKRAIEIYPKDTNEYKVWIGVFNEKKTSLEGTPAENRMAEDVEFLKDF